LEKYKEIMRKNKSLCPAAFKEIYADNAGRYRLCCHAKANKKITTYNEDRTLPFDYFLSEEMEEIRQKMFEGELLPECKTCYQIEKDSGTSYREKQFLRHGVDTQIRDVFIKLRMFGNYCNLACYMCHPYNSTERQKELNKIFPKTNTELYDKFIKKDLNVTDSVKYNHKDWGEYLQHILDNMHLIKYIHMTGGEPLQLPKYWQFLEAIPEEHAKNIRVSQDSNLTNIHYKNKSIMDIAPKFERFHVGISVDHYGDKLSYMRYPIDVEKFEYNLREISEYDVYYKANCTISILNIDNILQIRDYYTNNFYIKGGIEFRNIVRGPKYLSIRNLPQKMKDEYIEKYYEFPYIIAELKQPQNKPHDQFMEYCDRLSKNRNLDWRPMWKDFIKKYESNMR